VEGPAELFVEAVARVLAWVDEHKAYLFLTAAVAAGLIAAFAAMSLWGLIELHRLALRGGRPAALRRARGRGREGGGEVRGSGREVHEVEDGRGGRRRGPQGASEGGGAVRGASEAGWIGEVCLSHSRS
jgi:hypothetical protein